MIEEENEDNIEYKEKDIVWAKVKGYPWWPSIISQISFCNVQENGENKKEKVYSIEFIGEKNNAKVLKEKIEQFNKNYDQHSNTKNPILLKSIELAKKKIAKKQNSKIISLKENTQDKLNINIQNNQNLPTKKSNDSSEEKSNGEKTNDKNIKLLQKKRLNEANILGENNDENNNNNRNISDAENKVEKKLNSPKNNIKINININLTTNNQNMVNINSFHSSSQNSQNNQKIISNINYSQLLANENNNTNKLTNNNNKNNNLKDILTLDEESVKQGKDKNKTNIRKEEKNENNISKMEYNEEDNESDEENENEEEIITNDEINEIIQKLLNCQIQISNISSQKMIISELKKLSEKLNELSQKNQDLEIYNLTKDLIPILITFNYNKNNDILIKSSEILSFLNEKIINEIFNFSKKEKENFLANIDDEKEKDKINKEEINQNEIEENIYKEELNIIEMINQKNINKSSISEQQFISYSKRGRPKKVGANSEMSSEFFSSKISEGVFNIKDNYNFNEKDVYEEFMKIISCKDKDKMENDFKEISNNFFNNIYDKNDIDLDVDMAKIRKNFCIKIYEMIHKLFPEINTEFLKKVIIYFEYKIRNDNSNLEYSNKINSLFDIMKYRLVDKTK